MPFGYLFKAFSFYRLVGAFSAFLLAFAGSIYAQGTDQLGKSYITPFPDGERYKVYIIGDALAGGVHRGLQDAFNKDRRLEIKGSFKYGSGLARIRGFNWQNHLDVLTKAEKIHIAVFVLGLAEVRNISVKGKVQKFGSDEWRQTLGQRVGALLKSLKKKQVAVYWVGLPIVRSPKKNEAMQQLNTVFREQAFLNGVKFIDTFNGFADQFGRYSAYGADLTGKVRRLRNDDGVQFTTSGYRKFAHFVEREIRRDMALAKSERNIPLAGNEREQERISNSAKPKIKKRVHDQKKAKKSVKEEKKEDEGFFSSLQRRLLGIESSKEKKEKTNTGVTIVDGLKIVRPPLPELAGGFSRRNSASVASGIGGQIIAKTTTSGLTSLASVTPINDLSLKTAKQRVPLQQTPYYKVLVLGEALQSKPGRADDFVWSQKE